MTQYPGTNYEQTSCLNCSWYYHPPNPFVAQLPLKDYGTCGCGRESLRGSGDCSRCRGLKVSAGMRKHGVSVAV
jgi:hypothetical protein